MSSNSDFDVIVIGAGISGIVAAARYLQAHPDCRLAVIEQDYCVGGVWSKRRNYSNFWSQWNYGLAEFGDMSMRRPPAEDCMNDFFRAKYSTQYLEDYVDHIRLNGQTLRDRIVFETTIQSIAKIDDRWHLTCNGSLNSNGLTRIFQTDKLMVASGQTSQPRMPFLPDLDHFDGIVLHSIDFGESKITSNDEIQHITVLGGGKSAADMVYEAAKAGKTVSWIIRKTGDGSTGPGFLVPASLPTPYQNSGAAAQTRVMASLHPGPMNEDSRWTWFLHRTKLGVKFVDWFFSLIDRQIREKAAFEDRKSSKGFEKLTYDDHLFWQNGPAALCHHDDFYAVVAEKVNVYRGRIVKIKGNDVYLDDDNTSRLPCDAILCGTGWGLGLDMFSSGQRLQLGIPAPKDQEAPEITAKWDSMIGEADKLVLQKYPILRNPPRHVFVPVSTTPYRLYRGIAVLNDDSIVFMNHLGLANKLFGAEAQAMWAVAYFDGVIKRPSMQEMEKEVAMMTAWNKRRYLSNGQLANYYGNDHVAYVDTLLDQMGVTAHRQKGWLRNFFAPIMPADLGKAWKEYLENGSQ